MLRSSSRNLDAAERFWHLLPEDVAMMMMRTIGTLEDVLRMRGVCKGSLTRDENENNDEEFGYSNHS
jgi:hypothetical protein